MKLLLEQMLIDIAGFTDERGLKIAVSGVKLIIPKELQFIAERVLTLNSRPGTADNDAKRNEEHGNDSFGAVVNHFLIDTDAYFIKTDAPNGFKYFNRSPIKTAMEGDFDTGNTRFKARERYSFAGVSDWRTVFGTQAQPKFQYILTESRFCGSFFFYFLYVTVRHPDT